MLADNTEAVGGILVRSLGAIGFPEYSDVLEVIFESYKLFGCANGCSGSFHCGLAR